MASSAQHLSTLSHSRQALFKSNQVTYIMEEIYPASLLSSGCDQMIFKDSIFPSAEDPPNNTGCYVELRVNFRSLLQSQPEQKISRKAPKDKVCQLLDTLWQRVNIIFLGCTNPELDHVITGIMLQVKAAQNFRYQIWTNTEERETISSLVDYLNSHLDEVAKEAGCVCNYKFRNNQHRKYV